jgi:hypothetical protein
VAVSTYEMQMFDRVAKAAEGSAEATAVQLSHIGEALSLEHLQAHRAGAG